MTPEEKLQDLGIELPEARSMHPAMAPGVITGNLLYLSGATPPARDGQPWSGRVGETYTVEEGYQAARLCAIQQLAQAKAVLGDLSRITRVVKVLGMVNLRSRLRADATGDARLLGAALRGLRRARHPRPLGGRLQALPSNVPIEVETIFEIA